MKRGIIAGLLLFARAHLLADDYSEGAPEALNNLAVM